LDSQIKKNQNEIQQLEKQLEEISQKIEEKTSLASKVQEKYEQAEKVTFYYYYYIIILDNNFFFCSLQQMEAKREELKELKEAHDSLKKKVQKIREASVELTSQIEDESKAHDDFKKKITFWTGKMNSLTLQDLKAFGEPEDTLPKLTEEELNSIDKEKLQSSIVILEGIPLIVSIYYFLFLNHKSNNSFFSFFLQ